jgi:hypothetical protein
LSPKSPDAGVSGVDSVPLYHLRNDTEVWLDGDSIRWKFKPLHESEKEPETDGMLDAFAGLKTAEDVLGFVQRWGIIWFCEAHQLPNSHGQIRYSAFDWNLSVDFESTPCFSDESKSPYSDPVERYLKFSEGARAILRLASDLHDNRPGERQDWLAAYQAFFPDWEEVVELVPENTTEGTSAIAELVSEWLRVGAVLPRLSWFRSPPRYELIAGTFGILAVQLMQAVTQHGGIIES